MSVKVDTIAKNTVELEVTVSAEEFTSAVNRAAKKLANKVNVPGFRKGKAPRKYVEQYVGTQSLYNEALDEILGPTYLKAVDESGIQPVDRPDIDLVQIEDGKELIYKAKVTVRPEVELGEYKGLNVEKEAVTVTDEEVEAELKRRQEQHAKLLTLDEGSIQKGDTATIDFEGFVDGVAFPGGKGEGYDLVIGSNSFIPGFEDQLEGVQVGQEVDVNVKFPDEYHSEDLKGKEALFKVKVHKIKRKDFAALDDEFAKDISEFDTIDELKTDIRNKLLTSAEQRAESSYRNGVVQKAVDNASVEIPEAMINNRVDSMVEDLSRNLSYQGLNLEQYYMYTNSSEQDMRERFRPQAAEGVKTELVLEAIAKAEGIQVSEEEVNEELAKLAEQYKQPVDVLKKALQARGEMKMYEQGLVSEKTVNFLVEHNA